jgi:hypothetical protein
MTMFRGPWREKYRDRAVALGTSAERVEITDKQGHTVWLEWNDAALIARTILDAQPPQAYR